MFRKRFDCTPLDYVRSQRLRWAHRQLQEGDPKIVKVSAVARHAGWVKVSNFAVAYRKMFGKLPSETLYGHLRIPRSGA
jgi:AraC family ethanolamine operon transcriptional activator